MDSETIMPWFENIILRKDTESTKFKTDHIKVMDPTIYSDTLFNTIKLVRSNYNDFLAEEGKDDLVLLYTTSEANENQRNQTGEFN